MVLKFENNPIPNEVPPKFEDLTKEEQEKEARKIVEIAEETRKSRLKYKDKIEKSLLWNFIFDLLNERYNGDSPEFFRWIRKISELYPHLDKKEDKSGKIKSSFSKKAVWGATLRDAQERRRAGLDIGEEIP